jgi:hypothetical protein
VGLRPTPRLTPPHGAQSAPWGRLIDFPLALVLVSHVSLHMVICLSSASHLTPANTSGGDARILHTTVCGNRWRVSRAFEHR